MSNTVSSSGASVSVPVTLTLNPTPSLSVDDEATIRQRILTGWQADYAQQGLKVNVEPGSDYYKLATGFAREGAVVQANGVVQVDNFMPDSTQDITVLARIMAIDGVPGPRGATVSYGVITIACSAPSPVEEGDQLYDALNQLYEVLQAGTYAPGAQVPVVSVSTGAATQHINGDVLTWVAAPLYCEATVTVGTTGANDGLTGGADAENIESARARYLQVRGKPRGGGNSSQIILLGAQASPSVAVTAVYPAANGGSTVHIAVCGNATNLAASNAKLRALPAALVTGTIAPFLQGQLAEYAEVVVTSVVDVPVDLAIGLTLPAAPSATPAGPGGGWVDGQPWPANTTGASTFYCAVTAVTSSVNFTVLAPSLPIAGVSSIAMLDPQTWTLFSAHVASFTYTGSAGAYYVTVQTDAPLVNVAVGNFIFPQSVNQATYIAAALGSFAAMGPGEKTNAAGLLPRAARKPLPSQFFPYSIGELFLRPITQSGPEVAGSSFLFCSAGTPPVSPALPGAISGAPGCYGPNRIGLYPA